MTYTEFKRMHIDLGALGAEGGRNAVRYTCTPKGLRSSAGPGWMASISAP